MADDAVVEIRERLPHRPDVVFDCVASQNSIDQAIGLALKGGTVVVEGVPRGPVSIPLHLVQDRELRLQGTAMYVRQDVERAIELIACGGASSSAWSRGHSRWIKPSRRSAPRRRGSTASRE